MASALRNSVVHRFLLALSLSLVACDASDARATGGATAVSVPVPEDGLLDELKRVLCDRQARCGCEDSRSRCEELVAARFTATLTQLHSVRPSYDGACARAALDRVAGASCSTRVETILPYEAQAFCGEACRVFDVAADASCPNTGGLCPQGSYCSYGQTPGCQACPREGDACPNGACSPGLRCNAQSRCQRLPAVGEPCAQGACAMGECIANVCTAPLALGKACSEANQCESGYCPRGACDTLPGENAACPAGRCAVGLRCETAKATTPNEPPPPPRCVVDKLTACQLPYNF